MTFISTRKLILYKVGTKSPVISVGAVFFLHWNRGEITPVKPHFNAIYRGPLTPIIASRRLTVWFLFLPFNFMSSWAVVYWYVLFMCLETLIEVEVCHQKKGGSWIIDEIHPHKKRMVLSGQDHSKVQLTQRVWNHKNLQDLNVSHKVAHGKPVISVGAVQNSTEISGWNNPSYPCIFGHLYKPHVISI